MKDLIIVGAGGFGREAYYLAKNLGKWNIKGFIDDNQIDMTQYKITDANWIGTIKDWHPKDEEVFAMGIASPRAKEKVSELLLERGAQFVTMIGDVARVNPTAEIGIGCIITSGSIGDCVTIGDFVHVCASMLGQDTIVDDYSTTTAFVNIASKNVGKRCFIGSHSVLLADIGDDVKVCSGSVVFRKVKDGLTVMGNPAKKISF